MPKEVAAANQNADVSVYALAVGLFDDTFSDTSVDKIKFSHFRFAPHGAERKAQSEKTFVKKRYAN